MPELNKLKLKVCGLRDNVEEVFTLSPDYAGFIFYPKSPRYVGDDFSAERLESLPAATHKVGVFVNQPEEEVIGIATKFRLGYVQLHGDESQQYCRRIKDSGFGVIKAFAGNNELNNDVLHAYGAFIDFYLFDTRHQRYGGSGVTFDWSRLVDLDLPKPLFLSGGLDVENVGLIEALQELNIHAIDVNSRFEVSPGLKNMDLLRKLNKLMQRA